MAGVMVDSFHLRCFLRSLCSWCADISLCSMKLMVGGTWENSDCFRAGESVSVGFWEIFNNTIFLLLLFLHILNFKLTDRVNLTDCASLLLRVYCKICARLLRGLGREGFRTGSGPSIFFFVKQ